VERQLTEAMENRVDKSFEKLHASNLGHRTRETITEKFENGTNSVQHKIMNFEFSILNFEL